MQNNNKKADDKSKSIAEALIESIDKKSKYPSRWNKILEQRQQAIEFLKIAGSLQIVGNKLYITRTGAELLIKAFVLKEVWGQDSKPVVTREQIVCWNTLRLIQATGKQVPLVDQNGTVQHDGAGRVIMRDEYVDVGYGEGGASSWDHSIGSSEDVNHLKYLHRTRAVAIHRTRRQAIRSFAGLDLEQDKDEIEVDLNKKITQKKTKVAKDSTLKSIEEYLQSTIGKDRNAHNNKY